MNSVLPNNHLSEPAAEHGVGRDFVSTYDRTVTIDTRQRFSKRGTPMTAYEATRTMTESHWYQRYLAGTWEQVHHSDLVQPLVESIGNKQSGKGLYIYGGVGTGKSTLLGLIGRHFAMHYQARQMYVPVAHLMPIFLGKQSEYCMSRNLTESMMMNVPILFLDDLASGVSNEYLTSKLTEIVECRYANNRLTFVTSNYGLSNLAMIAGYERIASRLHDSAWMRSLEYNSPDRRG